MSSLISLAARECRVPEDWVRDTIRQGATRVVKIKIPKRGTSKYRMIDRPSSELEILQRWLLLRFFEKLEVHDLAMAFRKRRSIVSNAHRHKEGKYFIRIDLKNFFPSITFADLIHSLHRSTIGKAFLDEFTDARLFIERICFALDHTLPIGYVTSPVISNFVMFALDTQLEELVAAGKMEFGVGTVTRYADDIVFSTDKVGGCDKFLQAFSRLLAKTPTPDLQINPLKTNFTSRPGGSAIVTGLRVCADGHITVTRKHKDEVRLLLALHAKGSLAPKDLPILRGHLAYVRHAAPAFFTNLCLKYIKIIGSVI